MTQKLKKKNLQRGLGTDELSARDLLAGFTPDNFAPDDSAASEGVDKISAFLKGIDARLGQIVSGVITFTDQLFSPSGSRITVSYNLTAENAFDVLVNGVLKEEGNDYNRDEANDQIVWLSPSGVEASFPTGCRVRVRFYSTNAGYSDQFFDNGDATLTLNEVIGEVSRIDVYFNGALTEEGQDWTRDAINNQLNLVDNPTIPGTVVRVRVWM